MNDLLKLISSIQGSDLQLKKMDKLYSTAPKKALVEYIACIKLAPQFLEFIQDSLYINTSGFIYLVNMPNKDEINYKKLNSNNEIIDIEIDEEQIEKMQNKFGINALESWDNISSSNISYSTVSNFFQHLANIQKLTAFRSILNPDLILDSEWDAAFAVNKKFLIINDYCSSHNHFMPYTTLKLDQTIKDLVNAAQKLEKIVANGDTIIFVGNTPQLIRYPFEKIVLQDKLDIKTISLAISGHPGQIDVGSFDIIKNILTPDAHEMYKQYMQNMGLTKEYINNHKIFMIDCVNSGGGLIYLINAITEIAYDEITNDAMQNINVIALNSIDIYGHTFINALKERHLKIDLISLEMNDLQKSLDRISNDDKDIRLMPSANSYKWNEDFIKDIQYTSMHLFENPNDFFQEIFHTVDAHMQMLGINVDISLDC